MSNTVCPLPPLQNLHFAPLTRKKSSNTHVCDYYAINLPTEGEREAWWLLEVDQTFDCPLTAATTTVLQSELTSCKELLGLEPDNKCRCGVM